MRIFTDGEYSEGGRWRYIFDQRFALDPQHYVRAFLLLQDDLKDLFNYIEPADTNQQTFSLRVQQLLMRACVEVEANCTAVLLENGYQKPKREGSLNCGDYRLLNHTHRLAAYEVSVPGWHGSEGIRRPFANWDNPMDTLPWYQAYNQSKHDRHNNFSKATFRHLVDAVGGLLVLLTAQFGDEDFSSGDRCLALSGYSFYDGDGMDTAIGGFFRVKKPQDWPADERYDFRWQDLESDPNPIDTFDYNALMQQQPKRPR